MTRWIQYFNQSPFKRLWPELLKMVTQLEVDDKTAVTTIEELARLNKVLTFVDKIVANTDIDLTPQSLWSNCASQTEACLNQIHLYKETRNETHLTSANENADNLLTYVRPYMVAPEQAMDAIGAAVHSFTEQINGYARSFQERGSQAQAVLATAAVDAKARLGAIEEMERKARNIDAYFFEGLDGNDAVEIRVQRLLSQIEKHNEEIEIMRDELVVGPTSTSAKIASIDQQIHDIHERLKSLLSAVDSECSDLDRFYNRIFGNRTDEADGQREGGLKAELDDRMMQLTKFESEHQTRHDALFKKVEALLPGAASAGLASAYKAMKDSFSTPIAWYTRVFYGALSLLFLGGLVIVSESIKLWPPEIKLIQTYDWPDILRTMLMRIPVIVPVVWVAIFSATRRSQYERLQQEYSHKEALASSYESYKKQLQDLKINAEELQQTLISKAIDAIAYNASVTLDGKHIEKPPAIQLLEKLNVDDIKKLIDLARQKVAQ